MTKSWLKTVDAWRFERPLALLLGVAGAFMVLTIPDELLSGVPLLAGSLPVRIVAALAFGLLIGGAGYLAMRRPAPKSVATQVDDAPPAEEEEEGQLAAAEVSLRLRRSDRHPDAPARAPIFASRDLGAPFMEVGAFAPPPEQEAIPEGEYDELAPESGDRDELVQEDEAPIEAQADHETHPVEALIESAPVEAETPAPIAAFAPEEEPAPVPARAHRASLGEMMERLSAGLEQRAGARPSSFDAPPRGREPALRDALEELNRLAARRG